MLVCIDNLRCTICGELVENQMDNLETHLEEHEAIFDGSYMQDVLEYFDSL